MRYGEPMVLLAFLLSLSPPMYCTVTDGDTIRCGDERVRLLGINAPELPGHCRRGRECVKGDGLASKRSLERLVSGRPVQLERYGRDRYNRTLAYAFVDGVNLSCAQIKNGGAIYKAEWDDGKRLRRC